MHYIGTASEAGHTIKSKGGHYFIQVHRPSLIRKSPRRLTRTVFVRLGAKRSTRFDVREAESALLKVTQAVRSEEPARVY